MADRNLLEGLDLIPWSDLHHAFGSAKDVPVLLRALATGDAEAQQSAITELFNNIWHQGTVYEATPHALPFLIRVLEQDAFPDSASIACLVASIIDGRGYYDVHAPLLKDASPNEFGDEINRELGVVGEVRRIGADALPSLVPFLSDPEPEVRATVAEALSCYPTRAPEHLPMLQNAVSVEQDDEARARIQESLERTRRHLAG